MIWIIISLVSVLIIIGFCAFYSYNKWRKAALRLTLATKFKEFYFTTLKSVLSALEKGVRDAHIEVVDKEVNVSSTMNNWRVVIKTFKFENGDEKAVAMSKAGSLVKILNEDK